MSMLSTFGGVGMFKLSFLSVGLLWLLAAPVAAQECLTITPELATRAPNWRTGVVTAR